MEAIKKIVPKISFEEYLLLEQDNEGRNEFSDGTIIPIEATTKAHNRIKRNLIRQIETPKFDESGCELFDENVLTELVEDKKYVYPDIVVSCDPDDTDPLIVKSPTVVIEILSPSTKKYDKTVKFFAYQRIPSIQQCIFVAQDSIEIKSFQRSKDNQWILTTLESLEDTLSIDSLDLEIKLADIYVNIGLDVL